VQISSYRLVIQGWIKHKPTYYFEVNKFLDKKRNENNICFFFFQKGIVYLTVMNQFFQFFTCSIENQFYNLNGLDTGMVFRLNGLFLVSSNKSYGKMINIYLV